MFNIALLGAGRIGQVHAANIASHGATTLWSVVDPNQEFATRLIALYKDITSRALSNEQAS